MGASTVLPTERVTVMPGVPETCEVQVHNTGQVVDRFVIDVLGDAASWVSVEPETLNLFPGESGTAIVTFAPPMSSEVLAGEVPYAIRVMSTEDVEGSSVDEGVVEVAQFTDMDVELVPRTARGTRRGRQQVVVDNKGNHAVGVQVRVADFEDQLVGRTRTPSIMTEPGTATLVDLVVKPRRTFLRGPTRTLPFQVEVVPASGEPIIVDSALVQDQILPKWLPAALALAAAAVIALVVLWFTVFKPVISTTARQVAQHENAALSSQVAEAKQEAQQAKEQVAAVTDPGSSDSGQNGTSDGQNGASDGQNGTSNGGTNSSSPTARDFRIQIDAAPGAPGSYTTSSYSAPDGKTLMITDLILENPAGDKGLLQIRRGNAVLFSFGLENFRDLDYHFVKPIEFKADSPVVVAVSCQNTGTRCTPAAYFSGTAS